MREHLFRVTIKDCTVQTFRSGGKGGQNQNKRETGVRVIHPPSGAVGESREHRGQLENKREAFKRMGETQTFQVWARRMAANTPSDEEIRRRAEIAVDAQMRPENLLIEEGVAL